MKTIKKTASLALVFLMLFSVSAFAEEAKDNTSFRVIFDGEEIFFPDEQPFTNVETKMPDGTTYEASDNRIKFVPIRAISEALGYEVSWDGDAQTVNLQKDGKVASFVVGGQCYVNEKTKTCVVNFPLKNGRVFVSQFAVCHVFDCTLSWDETNRILYLYSKEKYPMEAELTQERYLKEDITHDQLSEFYSMAEPCFVIPGLQQALTPQGIAYRKDTNQFYITGYMLFGCSRMAVVDASTGELTAQFRLLKADGTPHTGHMSGVAVSDKNIYFVHGGSDVERISLAAIDSAATSGFLQIEETIKLSSGFESGNSYAEISDGYLWLGNYFNSATKSYRKKASENHNALIRGYKIDSTQPNGLAAEYKVENSKCDYIPAVIYSLEVDDCIQGMTSIGNYLVTASSFSRGNEPGLIRVFDKTKAANTDATITIGESTGLPVIQLNLEKAVATMNLIEEIAAVDDYLYTSFESGSQKCGGGERKMLADQIWKVNIEKLTSAE